MPERPAVAFERLVTRADSRGTVFEPLDDAGLAGQRNVHVVLTGAGETRGNHRHRVGTEIAVVFGPAQFRWREDDALHDFDVPDGEAWRITIPPRISHAYRNPGPGTLLIVAFNTEVHDPANPDVERDALF